MRKATYIIMAILIISLLGCAAPEKKTETPEKTEPITKEQPKKAPKVSSVSQEDLDRLKKDIEAIEPEDLGGLSE